MAYVSMLVYVCQVVFRRGDLSDVVPKVADCNRLTVALVFDPDKWINSTAVNPLYYGDNSGVLRHIKDERIDLVYLAPPFNSSQNNTDDTMESLRRSRQNRIAEEISPPSRHAYFEEA